MRTQYEARLHVLTIASTSSNGFTNTTALVSFITSYKKGIKQLLSIEELRVTMRVNDVRGYIILYK